MAADRTVDREQQVAVVLVAVVTDVLESAEEARVDSDSGNTVLNVALRKVLVDAETVNVRPRAGNYASTVEQLVIRRDSSDEAVTNVADRILKLPPERIVVEVVVPVELTVRRAVVGGAALLIVAKCVHVDLSPEPDEGLQDAGVVAGTGAVLGDVVEVLQLRIPAQVALDLERSV